ncbi:enoyl-CoA hydratase/isomerase family protein [Nocardia jinanensis]|uniref:enoyl-CoA hydratase/isomerase family protein n=1 Tax=Nocardia jinanensis TaxID=382504 RepID=UPI000ADF2AD6|nr:enoyl-CoA hydratase/isomerase family protein [Nocardia jinanensis]
MPDRHKPIRSELRGAVMDVVIDSATDLITVDAMRLLIEAFEAATIENALLLVIRSAGDEFTLGRDQNERVEGLSRDSSLRMILTANDALRGFPGISICAVRGRAFGFGAGLAVQSDLTIAEESASFAFDEVLHGLAPLIVAEYLPRYVGHKPAADLIFTGRSLSAEEALRVQLISRVVADGRLDEHTTELCDHLMSLERGALRLMKRYLLDVGANTLDNPRDSAVTRLDAWLTAGRPDRPGSAGTQGLPLPRPGASFSDANQT